MRQLPLPEIDQWAVRGQYAAGSVLGAVLGWAYYQRSSGTEYSGSRISSRSRGTTGRWAFSK